MPAIQLADIQLTIQGTPILKGVSWAVEQGEHAAVLGPNGSGKSTLLRIITGYQHVTRGTVHVLGCQIGRVDLHTLRRQIGLVDPGNPYPFARRMSVLDVVLTGFFGNRTLDFDHPSPQQTAQGREALEEVGLSGHENQPFHTLSTGESRRTLLARALVQDPKLLILDEPTAGLDLLGRETMLASIDQLVACRPELTTLLVTHHVEEISPRTSQMLLLHSGTVVAAGDAGSVLTSENVSSAFGCPVSVSRQNGRWHWQVQPQIWGHLVQK